MYISKKVIIALLVATVGFVAWYFYSKSKLSSDYAKRLDELEDEQINKFYGSSIKGRINYIKKYDSNPAEYVFSVKDSLGNEVTVGKVRVSNFSDVKENDLIEKSANTFELHVKKESGVEIISNVQYE